MQANLRRTLLFGLVLSLLAACMRPASIDPPAGMELTPIRSISKIEARAMLMAAGLDGVPVRHDVDLYRLAYPGVGPDRSDSMLSGLLALPRGTDAGRVVSFQHGTTTTRTAVPSEPDTTGLAAAILFAGNGYALVAPDYPGLGMSPGRHPYYVPESTGPSVVGMIRAAQQFDQITDAPPFLFGHSEGGWATILAVDMIERSGGTVLGAAPVAGVFDPAGISLPAALKGGAASHSLYLAYVAWGQSAYFDQPLESVLTPEYVAIVERLFAGASPNEIIEGLPGDPRSMLNPEFLAALEGEGAHWLVDSIIASSLTHVYPQAPVRLYYGSADKDVIPAEALEAAKRMQARGVDALAVDVGPHEHNPSMAAAAPRILQWLQELEAAAD